MPCCTAYSCQWRGGGHEAKPPVPGIAVVLGLQRCIASFLQMFCLDPPACIGSADSSSNTVQRTALCVGTFLHLKLVASLHIASAWQGPRSRLRHHDAAGPPLGVHGPPVGANQWRNAKGCRPAGQINLAALHQRSVHGTICSQNQLWGSSWEEHEAMHVSADKGVSLQARAIRG